MPFSENIENKNFFQQVYDGWLQFAELVGRFNTLIIVSIIYFCLVSLASVFARSCLRRQLLDRAFRVSKPSAWIERQEDENVFNLEKLKHQF